jgi:hypothetical protein
VCSVAVRAGSARLGFASDGQRCAKFRAKKTVGVWLPLSVPVESDVISTTKLGGETVCGTERFLHKRVTCFVCVTTQGIRSVFLIGAVNTSVALKSKSGHLQSKIVELYLGENLTTRTFVLNAFFFCFYLRHSPVAGCSPEQQRSHKVNRVDWTKSNASVLCLRRW